jgi:hypothetical protein
LPFIVFDIGKPIEVRLSGDRAYTTSKRLPTILLAIGGVFALGGGYELVKDRRRLSQIDSP